MSEDRSTVAADRRSIVPSIPGVPWWAAVVIAVSATAAGFAFDAGSGKDLTSVFSGLYVLGCLTAVLAVRQAGVFTAVIQPPLILFFAVPGAYFLFHGAKFTGVKDLVINCGYPLIERFPLMLFTSAGVLLVGAVRWVLGRMHSAETSEATTAADDDTRSASGRPGWMSTIAGLLHRGDDAGDPDDAATTRAARSRARREHAVQRSARSSSRTRAGGRPTSSPTRTRRPRPPLDEDDLTRDRARRRRPQRENRDSDPPRRSSRLPRDPEARTRRDPQARRPRPSSRSARGDGYETREPYDSGPVPARRPRPNGSAGTHHPISQVRYRKAAGDDEAFDERPRRPRRPASDSWNQ